MELDTSRWSGDGEFTQVIIERLRSESRIAHVRIEDSPATREDPGYTFISNEVFITPAVATRLEPVRRWLLWPTARPVRTAALTIADLEAVLSGDEAVGPPDVSDDGMLQYLRTQRIIPAYQTRGYKLIELIRLYVIG
jgi:hypothetical protein